MVTEEVFVNCYHFKKWLCQYLIISRDCGLNHVS
jgi:hypothetical protein